MSKDMKNFETSDIGLTVALFTYGFNIMELIETSPRKIVFIFKGEENLEQIISDYWDSKLILPAIKLISNHRVIKQRIYEKLKAPEKASE